MKLDSNIPMIRIPKKMRAKLDGITLMKQAEARWNLADTVRELLTKALRLKK